MKIVDICYYNMGDGRREIDGIYISMDWSISVVSGSKDL